MALNGTVWHFSGLGDQKSEAWLLMLFTVALRLIACLDRLLGKGSSKSRTGDRAPTSIADNALRTDGQHDLLILSTLDLIQGILLLHPPSRSLFARELYMNVGPLHHCLSTSSSLLDPLTPQL